MQARFFRRCKIDAIFVPEERSRADGFFKIQICRKRFRPRFRLKADRLACFYEGRFDSFRPRPEAAKSYGAIKLPPTAEPSSSGAAGCEEFREGRTATAAL